MALPPGKTIKEVYGRDVDVNAPIRASRLVERQAAQLDASAARNEAEAASLASRASERERKPNPKYKGGKSRRRHSRKSKKTRRSRKH